jgi:hypothetical protein
MFVIWVQAGTDATEVVRFVVALAGRGCTGEIP